MAIEITIDNLISGTSPYNVWVTDNCVFGGTNEYIGSFTTSTYSFTLPTLYESFPTYYVKVIDANNCTYCISPPISGCTIFVGYWDGNQYYKYNLSTDTEEGPLSLPITPEVDDSLNANTDDKLWFRTTTGATELDITITPFSATYNRDITINLDSIKQLYSIDNDNLLVCATNTGTSTTHIYDALITGTTAQTTTLLEVVGSLSGNTTIKDIKLSTENKILLLGKTGSTEFLQQYDYVSSGSLELEINLSAITNASSIVETNDQLFILNNSNEIYQINLTPPYLITFYDTSTTPIGFGRASQKYGCITNKFEI